MMNDDLMSDFTGMPRPKRTRRGRGRGHGPKSVGTTAPDPHVEKAAAISEAVANGDHSTAKSLSLGLANALHRAMKQSITTP